MGGSQSFSSAQIPLSSIEQNYVLEKDTKDPRYGQVKIYKNKSDIKQYLLVLAKSSLDEDFLSLKTQIQTKNALKGIVGHESLCKFVGYFLDEQNNLCGSSSKLYFYSEFFKNNLEKELQKKVPSQVIIYIKKIMKFFLFICSLHVFHLYFIKKKNNYTCNNNHKIKI